MSASVCVCACVRVGTCVCEWTRDINKTGKKSVRKESKRREAKEKEKAKGHHRQNADRGSAPSFTQSHYSFCQPSKGFLQSLLQFQGLFPPPLSVSWPADRNSMTYLT